MRCIRATEQRQDPNLPGLSVSDDEWKLDVDYYRPFVEVVTGLPVPEDLTAADCYRIGNRLEAVIAEHERDETWPLESIATFPIADSRTTVRWLARFFRACHQQCHPNESVSRGWPVENE